MLPRQSFKSDRLALEQAKKGHTFGALLVASEIAAIPV